MEPPRTDDRGICYGSGSIVAVAVTDERGILVGTCAECGRVVGILNARVVPPLCLNWHRPTEPTHRDTRSRPGRVPRRKVLVDG